MLYYAIFNMHKLITKGGRRGASGIQFLLALAVITLHLVGNYLSLLSGWVIKGPWVEGVNTIIDFLYQATILYFCWRYSTRSRPTPRVEQEEPVAVSTEELTLDELEQEFA